MAKFLGLDLKTTKNTFIPRPETELLVEVCLNIIEEEGKGKKDNPIYILDIGTGTGNIAISLTKDNEDCKIVALDRSEEALAIAKENAIRHGVSDRIEFVKSDLFESLQNRHCEGPLTSKDVKGDEALRQAQGFVLSLSKHEAILFDLIVSNPPYVPRWEIPTLADYVQAEPRTALDGGEDGLDFYKRIIDEAPRFLRGGGYLIMETGYNQSYHVKELLKGRGNFTNIEIFKDFSNIDRVIKARRNKRITYTPNDVYKSR